MTLQPLLDASFAIQAHTVAAILAFFIGGVVLFRRKGDHRHRMAGRIWVGLMAAVSLSSFFIHSLKVWGMWSPIHLLSIATLVALVYAIAAVRRRDVATHARAMKLTYLGALVIAGIFTFMPGRIMNEVFFGGPRPLDGVLLLAAIAVAGAIMTWMRMKPKQRRRRAMAAAAR